MALIIIPARMAAQRLPGKPLAEIAGRPMIAWMAELARAAQQGPVLVAAGEAEIAEAASAAGAEAVLTDPALPSGTDRVHAAAESFDPGRKHEVIVNLQGDMPTMRPGDIALAINALRQSADIATLVSPSAAPEDRANPNIVKAIRTEDGRCLYFTRADAPSGAGPIERHVGIYVYRRQALSRFVAAAPTKLEQRERLEQLRALELGMTIVAGVTDDFPKGVDGPDDLAEARRQLEARI